MSNIAVAVKGLKRTQIRMITKNVRNITGTKTKPIKSIPHWFENNFIPKSDFDFDICDDHVMGDNHALTDHEKNMIFIREDVYEGAHEGIGRDRMTIAHEVGHCILHVPERIIHARSFGTNEKVPTFQDAEWQAKAFAGELLVPHELLEEGMRVSDIVDVFGVSSIAAGFQAKIYEKEGLIKLNGSVTEITDPKIVWTK